MRHLLLILLLVVTDVAASEIFFKGVEVMAEDEKMAQASMMQMVRGHDGDEHRENVFDYMAEGMKEFFEDLNSVSDEDMGLDNRTDTGFDSGTDGMMWAIYGDICNQGGECTNSPFMGCNCHGHFNKLDGMCQEIPCRLVKHGLENAAQLLRDIRKQTSLEGLIEVGMKFAEPILKNACHCNPSLFETVVSCVKDYNGAMIGDRRQDQKQYKKFMRKIKFDNMIVVAKTMFGAYCGNPDGKCLRSFESVFTELAAMMDRSCDGEQEDQCNNFRRLSGGIWNFIDLFMKNDGKKELTLKMIVKEFYKNIPENFWCGDAKCAAGYLSDIFNNNCCFRNAVDQFDEDIVHHLEKYIQSITKAAGGKLPKLGKAVRKMISQMINPNKACGSKYSEYADECNRLEYYLL